MGKHGKRASAFKASLEAAGYDVLETPREHGVAAATTKQLSDEVRVSIVNVYRALGGVRDDAEFTAGVWDFACSDGLFIEFDEALHFNRYRPVTLETPWSSELPWALDYSGYSEAMEGNVPEGREVRRQVGQPVVGRHVRRLGRSGSVWGQRLIPVEAARALRCGPRCLRLVHTRGEPGPHLDSR